MKSEVTARSERIILAGGVLFAFLFALFFGFTTSLERGIWFDEALTTYFISLNWDQLLSFMAKYEANMGLYYVLLKVWSAVSYSEVWLRVFSFIAFSAAALFLYLPVRRYLGFRVAGVFLILFFSHFYLLRYGVEIRGYSLAMLFIALLWFAWSGAVIDNKWQYWIVYAGAGMLGVHAHLFVALGVFSLGVVALFMLHGRQQLGRWFWAHVIIVASFAPLAIFVLQKESGQLGWLTEPGVRALIDLSFLYSGASAESADLLRRALLLMAVLASGTALFLVVGRRANEAPTSEKSVLVASAAVSALPVVLVFLVSQVQPSFSPRFFVPFLPFFLIIVAYGLVRACSSATSLIVPVVLLAMGFSTVSYENREGIGWKSIFINTAEHCNGNKAMLVVTHHAQTAIRYYNRTLPVSCELPMLPFAQSFDNHFTKAESYPEELENIGEYEGVWVFETHADDRKAALLRRYLETIEREVGPCEQKQGNAAISVLYCGDSQKSLAASA
jgi:hypothetical protein